MSTTDKPTPPHRACRFVLDLQADTRRDLANALSNMADQIDRGEMGRGVSGGYSTGYIYELIENDHPTHDEWYAELRAYLDALDAKKVADGLSDGPEGPT